MTKINISNFAKKAYEAYIKAGLTPTGACGLMGNQYSESAGFLANRVEFLLIQRFKEDGVTYTDATYTAAVDSGKIGRSAFLNPRGKKYGYGLCQWTTPERKAGLYDLAKKRGVSIADEQLAIDYTLKELKMSYPKTLEVLKSAKTVAEASDYVLQHFEAPANWQSLKATRRDYGQQYFDKLTKKEDTAVKDLWTKTAELMADQVGYLEKASNYNLDSKTGGAGYNNYTKYARDVNSWGQPGCQGQPWCAVYQFWICVKVFGLAKALQIMGGGFYNCNSVKNHAKKSGTWSTTPKLGALIIFRNGAHIGRVTKVTSTNVYTNEGNTSKGGTNNVVANGGCVADKVYTRNYSGIDGYVIIDYGTETESGSTTAAGQLNTSPKWVGEVTASELNVRSWAGAEYPKIKKWPLLKRTNKVDVCDSVKASDGSTWYYVRIAAKYYGFVHSAYIKRV